MATLTEDDIFRASSQYRVWGFTPDSLASQRSTTNSLAIENVRAAVRSSQIANGCESTTENEVECLTVDEEQRLVAFFCVRVMELADFYDFPTNVKATAVQYMKRFYVSNSPMTYHPKEMMLSALFFSTKTENHYIQLGDFVHKLGPKTYPDDVVAPEFLLVQGLKFVFDVRHPQRGLEGGYMELTALAKGRMPLLGIIEKSRRDLQEDMLSLKPAQEGGNTADSINGVIARIQTAYGKAKDTLKTSALLTDAYFFYTPSQLWLGAFWHADEPLTQFYIDLKLPASSPTKQKLVDTLQDCGRLFDSSPSANPGKEEIAELREIDKKLYRCRNPEKTDLVGINNAQKRDGEEDGLDEKMIKKRKLEREAAEKEAADVFGPLI